jgi:metal-responsive CopG/Arc/MetJ family transcriptional regulator
MTNSPSERTIVPVRIRKDGLVTLDRKARQLGWSRSHLIRTAVQEWLRANPPRVELGRSEGETL